MKESRVKEIGRLVADETEFRLGQDQTNSDHDIRSLTVIVDFDQTGLVRDIMSRVELKRRVV